MEKIWRLFKGVFVSLYYFNVEILRKRKIV